MIWSLTYLSHLAFFSEMKLTICVIPQAIRKKCYADNLFGPHFMGASLGQQ